MTRYIYFFDIFLFGSLLIFGSTPTTANAGLVDTRDRLCNPGDVAPQSGFAPSPSCGTPDGDQRCK